MKKLLDIAKYVLLSGAAVLLVYLAFRKVDWEAFLAGLAQTRWIWVVIFCFLSVLALLGRVVRWKELLAPFDDSIGAMKIWDANNIGNLASAALPSTGEILRCGYISSKKLQFDKALGTMLCERIWDLIAIIVLTVVSLSLQWERFGGYFKENIVSPLASAGVGWILLAVIVLAAVFIVLMFKFRDRSVFCNKAAESVSRLGAGILAFTKSKKKFLVALSTFFIWFMYVLMSFCIIKAMPSLSGLTLSDAAFLSLVGNIASVVPVPGGIGAYHYLVAAAVGLYGHSWEMGLLFATLNHEIHAVVVIVLGVVSYIKVVRDRSRKHSDVNKPEESIYKNEAE